MRSVEASTLGLVVLLLAMLTPLSARAQGADDGATIFSTNCSGCHGSDGRGGERAPNIATSRNVASLSERDLSGIIHNGIAGAGMPSFSFLGDKGLASVVAYLRVLQGKTQIGKLSGDAEAGRQLFFGQAECGSCHMVHGVGGFIASDLTGYASGVGQGDILKAIVSQPQVIPENSEVVDLVTASGERLRGVRRSEDNFNLVVQLRSGRYRRFRKADLKKLTYTGHWLMPVDYGKRLTPRQLDDIVSYLARSSSTVDPSERRNKGGDE